MSSLSPIGVGVFVGEGTLGSNVGCLLHVLGASRSFCLQTAMDVNTRNASGQPEFDVDGLALLESFTKTRFALEDGTARKIILLDSKQIRAGGLQGASVVVFGGGSGSAQAADLGTEGKAAVRQWVCAGGRYVGVCGGAFLALSGFRTPWSLELLPHRTKSAQWKRGSQDVSLRFELMHGCHDNVMAHSKTHYCNGPIIHDEEGSHHKVIARFQSEVGTPKEGCEMLGSIALMESACGDGTCVFVSPHFEETNCENGWQILRGLILVASVEK